jgi:hypothetical protein
MVDVSGERIGVAHRVSHGTRPEGCRTRHVVRHILDIFRCRRTPLYKSRVEASSRGAPPYTHPAPRIEPQAEGRASMNSGQRPANHFTRTPDSGPRAAPVALPHANHSRQSLLRQTPRLRPRLGGYPPTPADPPTPPHSYLSSMRFVTLHTRPPRPPASYPLRLHPLHYTKK